MLTAFDNMPFFFREYMPEMYEIITFFSPMIFPQGRIRVKDSE
jgi:hypothetical protein